MHMQCYCAAVHIFHLLKQIFITGLLFSLSGKGNTVNADVFKSRYSNLGLEIYM